MDPIPSPVTSSDSLSGPSALSSSNEIGQRDKVVVYDLSTRVFEALETHLLDEGHHLVEHVHVFEGWGGIHFVDVSSGIRRSDAGAGLEDAIHRIIGEVLHPLRHSVTINWAT